MSKKEELEAKEKIGMTDEEYEWVLNNRKIIAKWKYRREMEEIRRLLKIGFVKK